METVLNKLRSVLCDPEGKCCISGSDEDRAIVDEALAALSTLPPQAGQKPVGYMNAGHVHELQQKRAPYGYVYPDEATGAHVAVYTSPQPEQVAQDAEHAENYRLIRRGQHWSVVDGIGNTLRGEDLDAAVGAIRAARARG